jgi:hypothetical protein
MKRSAFRLLACIVVLSGLALAQQPVNLIDILGTAPSTAGFIDVKGADGNVFVRCNAASTCPVNANEAGTWSVRIQDTSGNGLTTNSTTYTAKFGLDANLLGTLGTAFTTAGFVDIKGADGNVFVRQATAANLNATVVGTGTFVVQAAESGTWNNRVTGNAGGIFDTTAGATAAANSIEMGGVYNSSAPSPSNGQQEPLQLDSTGKLLVNCTGCSAGSTVSLIPATTGGVTMSHLIAAASTNGTSLKASAGQLYGASIYNNAAYPVYLKFYNLATTPTVGTSTVVYEVPVQAGTEREVHSDEGLAFGTGIAYAITKGITDADATALLLSDASVDLIYK